MAQEAGSGRTSQGNIDQNSDGSFSSSALVPFEQLDDSEIITPEKVFRCPLCAMECQDRYGLRRHYMIHTGEKPFACNLCSYRAAQKVNLKIHMAKKHSQNFFGN